MPVGSAVTSEHYLDHGTGTSSLCMSNNYVLLYKTYLPRKPLGLLKYRSMRITLKFH